MTPSRLLNYAFATLLAIGTAILFTWLLPGCSFDSQDDLGSGTGSLPCPSFVCTPTGCICTPWVTNAAPDGGQD